LLAFLSRNNDFLDHETVVLGVRAAARKSDSGTEQQRKRAS
jgi:hypothetical protein